MTSFEVDETITIPVALVENYLYEMREIHKHPDFALFARAVPHMGRSVTQFPNFSPC